MWLNITLSFIIGVLAYHDFLALLLSILILIHILIKKRYVQLIYCFFALLIGIILVNHHQIEYHPQSWDKQASEKIQADIIFSDEVIVDGDLMKGTMNYDDNKFAFTYRLKDQDEQRHYIKNPLYYKRCYAEIEFKRPLPNTNALKFHYDIFLAQQNIFHTAQIIELTDCHPIKKTFMEEIAYYRIRLADEMMAVTSPVMKYVVALTLGDMRYMDDESLNQLKALGIYHLYAISGSHISLISVQLYFLFKRFYIPIAISKFLILMLLPIYTLFTGCAPSVLRAGVFIMIYLLLKKFHVELLEALAISFLILICFDFDMIYDVGFQLSYLITFCMLLIVHISTVHHPLILFLLTSTIAHFASVVLLLLHFNEISWLGLFTNIIFVPLFSFILFPLCTIYLLSMMFFRECSGFLIYLIEVIFQLNDFLVRIFSSLHWTSIVPNQPLWLYSVLALCMFFCIYHFRKLTSFALLLTLYTVVILLISQPLKEDRITFLDVGQGDATVIESDGMTMVIDTGGRLDFKQAWQKRRKQSTLTDQVLLPYLKERGRYKIDFLVLTHPDQDHFGEAVHLMEHIEVEHIIINKSSYGVQKYGKLIQLAKKTGTTIINQKNISTVQLGRATVTMNSLTDQTDENNSSIVSRIDFLNKRFLLLGDLSKEGEAQMKDFLCEERIEVIKVGHHGSDTSTSSLMLDCIGPRYAIISSGRNNRFGHPHESVVELLETYDIEIFDTQKVGRITFDGKHHHAKEEIKIARQ